MISSKIRCNHFPFGCFLQIAVASTIHSTAYVVLSAECSNCEWVWAKSPFDFMKRGETETHSTCEHKRMHVVNVHSLIRSVLFWLRVFSTYTLCVWLTVYIEESCCAYWNVRGMSNLIIGEYGAHVPTFFPTYANYSVFWHKLEPHFIVFLLSHEYVVAPDVVICDVEKSSSNLHVDTSQLFRTCQIVVHSLKSLIQFGYTHRSKKVNL